ncbi:MAG TPA: glycosyl transferase family 2 [Elusimicrobia bacterium]|jgi:hypothetical protein|nr:glycosyl transferase family 2 [Elusimicrobiota bacterium]
MRPLILIPAYNEEKNIGQVIEKIRQYQPACEILVINDASTDDTARIAREKNVEVISHPFNLGYGAVLQTGYKYALNKGYDYLVQLDADGQHDPIKIKDFIEEFKKGEVDLIIGSRFLNQKHYPIPFFRLLGIKIFGFLVSLFTGQKITDSTSGYQGFNRKVLEFYTQDFFPSDFPDADVLILAHRAGIRIKEIPATMYSSSRKSIHSGLRPLYYIFKMFLSIFILLISQGAQNTHKGCND